MSQSQMLPNSSGHAIGLLGADAVSADSDSLAGVKSADVAPRARSTPPTAPRMHCFEFRALLQAERQKLLARLHGPVTASDDGCAGAPAGSTMATAIEESHEGLHIDAALARIAAGTYGICIACGREVGRARLKADPASLYCQACQIPVSPALAN